MGMRKFLLIFIAVISVCAVKAQTPLHKLIRKHVDACPAPSSPSVIAIETVAVTIGWTESSPASSYGYNVDIYKTSDNSLVAGSVGATGTSVRITGLTANTQYYAKVRTRCSIDAGETFTYSTEVTSANFTTSAGIEARINMSLNAVSVSTYNNLSGGPKTGVRSISNLNNTSGSATGWAITTIATANWRDSTYTVSATDGIAGMTAASFFAGSTSGVWANGYYQLGSQAPGIYTAGTPQFRFTGLDQKKIYTILIGGADGTYTFDASQMEYRVSGLTTPSVQTINGNVTSITTGATFDIQPTSGGQIDVYANTVSGSNKLNMIQAIIIKEK